MSVIDHIIPRRIIVPTVKLVAAGIVAALLFIMIQNAIKNPADYHTNDYTADFADASGLRPNADVRIRGVRVGKVTGVDLTTAQTATVARASFTLDEGHRLTTQTKVAIKYANLSGVRYLDVIDADSSGARVVHLATAQTQSSFDITELFNGLQPALTTLSPSDINAFTNNALTLLQGDGSGLKPLLASIDKLSSYANDRERVVSVLVSNLARISDSLGGKSPQIIEFLRDVQKPIDSAMTVLDEFPKAAKYGPPLMTTVNQILAGLGIEPSTDLDALLSEAFPTIGNLESVLNLIPTIVTGLQAPIPSAPVAAQCSAGVKQLPALMRVLVNGSGVVICNAK